MKKILLIIVLLVAGIIAYRYFPQEQQSPVSQTEEPAESSFLPTKPNEYKPEGDAPQGMTWIPGGEFSMGSIDPRGLPHGGHSHMNDARPIHRVYVDGFWMDKTEITNEQFNEFVNATGYFTVAEKTPLAEDFPGAPPENLIAGSVVFSPPDHSVSLDNHYQWWSYVHGANWRHPYGPDSDIREKMDHPVVHLAYKDAAAYCKWSGKQLPTEAEWEFAARGGLTGKLYSWGDEFRPGGKWMANIFQGHFPDKAETKDGYKRTAPVGQFPPNGYGLFDMGGNVWEWVSDWYRPDYYAFLASQEKIAGNPKGPDFSYDPMEPGQKKRVHRGGSFLCTEQYCTRYMVGTRGKGEISTGTDHLGFRCVMKE